MQIKITTSNQTKANGFLAVPGCLHQTWVKWCLQMDLIPIRELRLKQENCIDGLIIHIMAPYEFKQIQKMYINKYTCLTQIWSSLTVRNI